MNKQGKKIRNNIILFAAAVILGLSFITSVDDAVFSSVALDQEARCGMEEHQHTDDCYNGSILGCGKEIHTHSSSCYMLLLEENNVNTILEKVDDSEGQTLDNLVADTINQAVKSSGSSEKLSVAKVNKLSVAEESETLVLNEKMKTRYGQVQILAAPALETDAMVMAAAEAPATDGNYLNFYIYLDGKWTFIDNMEYSQSGWGQAQVSRGNVITLINDALGTDYDRSDFRLAYSTSSINSNNGTTVNINNNTTLSFGYNSGPIYVRIVPSNGNWSSTKLAFNTLTLVYSDMQSETRYVKNGSSYTFPSGYYWSSSSTGATSTVTSATIRNASTYYAYYRVQFRNPDGTTTTRYVRPGKNTQLPTGCWWGTGPASAVQGGTYVQVNENITYYSYYQVKYVYKDSTTTEYIRAGNSITLPADYIWADNYGNVYDGGDSVRINRDTTFTAESDDQVVITYNVNFPSVSGVEVDIKPTVMGGNTHSGTVEEGQTMTVHNVSQTKVEGEVSGADNELSRVIQFRGWRVNGGDTILQPGRTLIYDDWKSFGKRVTLTGVWEYNAKQTVSFFVKYDSEMTDASGNYYTSTNLFTPEIFASFLENVNTGSSVNALNQAYRIDSTNYNNTGMSETEKNIQVDKDIRAYANPENGKGIYLLEFPSDEYVFEQLQKYAKSDLLSVDGITVKAEDLHDNGYTIRWYVFKSQDDAWHIDGMLVRKIGKLEISKTFAGNAAAITAVKAQAGNDAFYIQATNGTSTQKLTLNPTSYESYDETTDTYTWIIDNIVYNEEWTISERNYMYNMTNGVSINPYAEYVVVDATGEQSSIGQLDFSQGAASVKVKGMTYAEDAGPDEIMSVDFTNIYRGTDSIIIKKEDTETGRPLGGAKFKLIQDNTELRFNKTSSNVFVYSAYGSITEIESTSAGFAEVSVNGLDFTKGNIEVEETKAPDGYVGLSGNIILTKSGSDVTIVTGDTLGRMEEGVLVIGNTSETVDVTVNKHWNKDSEKTSVEIQLLANGRLANTIVNRDDTEIILSKDSAQTYTWEDLPKYANGSEIDWKVREVKIGSEQVKADFSFANWIVTEAKSTGSDDKITWDLTNTRREGTTLMVIKEGQNGEVLANATFQLQLMDPADPSKPYAGMEADVQTSNTRGIMNFANLPYGKYTLTETMAPLGYYELTEPILLTINDDHTVSIQSGGAEVRSATDLAIVVRNIRQDALPETGGSGTGWMYMIGLLLMAAGAVIVLTPYYLRKERNH